MIWGLTGSSAIIKTIGLYNTKAKNVMAMAEILVNDYNGQVPQTREELVKLPGVGRKTANVVLNIVFKQTLQWQSTPISFVSVTAQKWHRAKNPDQVEKQLEKVVPAEFAMNAHHWLILHGRYTCKARTPECTTCIVEDLCNFDGKKT